MKRDYQSKLNRSQQMFNQSIHWYGDILRDLYLFLMLLFLHALSGCNSKPVVSRPINSYFSINGNLLNTDVSVLQDSIDKYAVVVNVMDSVSFEGKRSASPDKELWYLDGKLIEQGKSKFKYSFEVPGFYQIKHCLGLYDCVTRYIGVQEVLPFVEAVPEPVEIVNEKQPKAAKGPRSGAGGNPKPPVVDTSRTPPPPPPTPPPVVKPPESFKNSAITGLSSGSYKADCAKWVESASIKLKPKEFCLLHTAVLYSNSRGKVRINLTDGGDYNESMSIVVTEGRTQFAFSDLIPVLYPDRVYTLTISSVAGTDGLKPKIANISSCNVSPKATSALAVEYGSNSVLFDINYKVK